MASLKSLALLVALSGVGQTPQASETVLLDFTLANCAPCVEMAPVLDDLTALGYPIRHIDVGQRPELVREFHVEVFPTYLLMKDGQEVDRVSGIVSGRRIAEMFSLARPRPAAAQDESSPTVTFRGQSPDAQAANQFPGQPTQYTLSKSAAAPRMETPPSAANADAFTAGLIESTVRLRVNDPGGHSYGTGTIIDARQGEALVLTCGHIFRDSEGRGAIVVDAVVDGAIVALDGQLISFDEKRDLGLVSIRPDGMVRAAPVADQAWRPTAGEPVWSVGCNGGAAPSVEATRISALDRYAGYPNIEIAGMPVEGRSGGGLFNERGEVIGVCFAADSEYNEGLYAAAGSIQSELDRLGLTDVYRSESAGALAVAGATSPAVPSAMPAALPPTSPLAAVTPTVVSSADMSRLAAVTQVQHATPREMDPFDGLSPSERTVLAELSARSEGGQVICIIQPATPGAQSEIIVLNNASATLLEQLAALRRESPAARLTSLDVPNAPAQRTTADSLPRQDSAGWGGAR